ncbi:MAG: DUF1549 domain-containing protein [Chryseolinea sp.]
MIVHFPISLLAIALLMEFLQWKRKSSELEKGIVLLLVIGASSAIVAVAFGLFLINTETYGSELLPIHQWTGIATMILSMATVYAAFSKRESARRILLIVTVVGVTVAGHYGASLTHGEDYLSSVLPFHDKIEQSDYSTILNVKNGPLTEAQQQELTLQVRTIFAHNCYKCHGQVKTKGELRLDGKANIMKGGKDGPLFIPGKPSQSELIRRITLPRNHKEAMPEKGEALSKQEIEVLELWIAQGAPYPDGPEKSVYRVAEMAPRSPNIPAVARDLQNPIDLFVNDYFEKNKIKWSPVTDDHTYMRRVYLDVLGLLPPPDSIDAFVKDTNSDKRMLLVSRLLRRNDDYAQHWITFWNDALRNDYTGTGYITGGRFDITSWLYTSLEQNKPYNQFVKELISPTKESKGFIAGIEWRGTINASQRTEMQAAQNVSQVLLGLNLKCASCHDSFISDWKLEEAYAFANIFADTTLEINRCDKPTGKFAGRKVLFKELGEINGEAVTSERLKQLADFLVQPKDGRLYRTLVNRIWAQLMGRGIVEPVDVMDNEPWSQDLLDWLASDFVNEGYDIKKLIAKILTSKTYQLPSTALEESSMLTAQDFVFKGMIRRRLTAEQFTDAVSASIQPVYPDTLIVKKLLPKTIISQIPFARASLVKNDPFQTALGRPNRETVSTSRSSQANLLQALELTNGTHFNEAIKLGAISWRKEYPDTKTLVEKLYRKALGREPEEDEMKVATKALGEKPTDDQLQDFIWALTLHPEFQLIF